jgi:putative aldouronate transport system permease protein
MKSLRRKKKLTAFDIVIYAFLTLGGLMMILPVYYAEVISLSDQTTALKNPIMLIPGVIDFSSYKIIFEYSTLWMSLINSTLVVAFGVTYNLLLTTLTAYAFSKDSFPGKKLFMNLIVFTMYFGGGLIPFYLLVKNLGLIDHLAVMILPTGLSIFYMLIMKSFFEKLPKDLLESARIDGANEIYVLFKIILPISLPIMATIGLFYAVDRWNDWFNAMIFINDKALYPIQLALRDILGSTEANVKVPPGMNFKPVYAEGVKMASVIVAMLPIAIIYPFLHKYFAKGLLIGSVKE